MINEMEKDVARVLISEEQIRQRVKEMGAQILLFGHTHRPLVDYDGTLWVMNPGSVGRGNPCTYGIITISGGRVNCSTYRI